MRFCLTAITVLIISLWGISTIARADGQPRTVKEEIKPSPESSPMTLACTLNNWKRKNQAWYFCIGAVEGVEQGIFYALFNGLIDGLVSPENSVTLASSNHGVAPTYSQIRDPVERINKKYADSVVAILANICPPQEVTGEDQALAVTNYLSLHRKVLSEKWGATVIDALRDKWPCSKNTESK